MSVNVDYDVTINDDANVKVAVYPGTTTPTGPEIESVTVNADASDTLAVTGLTSGTNYLISYASDLISTPVIAGTFTML